MLEIALAANHQAAHNTTASATTTDNNTENTSNSVAKSVTRPAAAQDSAVTMATPVPSASLSNQFEGNHYNTGDRGCLGNTSQAHLANSAAHDINNNTNRCAITYPQSAPSNGQRDRSAHRDIAFSNRDPRIHNFDNSNHDNGASNDRIHAAPLPAITYPFGDTASRTHGNREPFSTERSNARNFGETVSVHKSAGVVEGIKRTMKVCVCMYAILGG